MSSKRTFPNAKAKKEFWARERKKTYERRKARQHRHKIVVRDGERCRMCGKTENLTMDHIKPISRGGTSNLENLQLLCKPCNRLKDSYSNEEIEKYLLEQIDRERRKYE